MTILSNDHSHVSFRFQSLKANLALYHSIYDECVASGAESTVQANDSFFRYLFYFFLDKDELSFENLMDTCAIDFYSFFNRMCAFVHYTSPHYYSLYVKDVVVVFKSVYQDLPERWPDIISLVRHLNEKPFDGNYDSPFWTFTIDSKITTVPPILSTPRDKNLNDSENYARSFFALLKDMMQSFVNRMNKISFVSWVEVFDSFYSFNKDCHFLNIMEMTEEYFSKIDHVSGVKKEEEENEDPSRLLRSFFGSSAYSGRPLG